MHTDICSAIHNRSVIEFFYDGYARTIEPYCHGISRAGSEVLRAYQIGGYSKSGQSVGWKLFDVAKISSLRLTDRTFSSNRSDYHPGDRSMTSIHCRV